MRYCGCTALQADPNGFNRISVNHVSAVARGASFYRDLLYNSEILPVRLLFEAISPPDSAKVPRYAMSAQAPPSYAATTGPSGHVNAVIKAGNLRSRDEV